jgi:hypothetical protein
MKKKNTKQYTTPCSWRCSICGKINTETNSCDC